MRNVMLLLLFPPWILYKIGVFFQKKWKNLLVQLYSIPLLKQQICIPTMLGNIDLNDEEKMILGYGTDSAKSVLNWRERRLSRI